MAMIFKRFYDEKLAQASYLVACTTTGQAIVVDPNRDVERYFAAAEADGVRVTHVTETHIHADFISGARELAQLSGAKLFLSGEGGTDWQYAYAGSAAAELLRDGSCFQVGTVHFTVRHVPGHTPEHLAFLVTDTATGSEPMGALTGDFLFVGDVGRPDLLERAARIAGTMEQSARQLFRSLQRFRELPDYVQIWPGHGAGSACGKSLSAVPQSTLGYERRFNWAFGVVDEDEFVRAVLAGQPEPPRYFAQMKRINRVGPRILGGFRRPARLPLGRLAAILQEAVVVDTRPAKTFVQGAAPGTVNIPLSKSFVTYAGSVLPYDRDFYLIIDDHRSQTVDEVTHGLAGIGLDRIAGYWGTEVIDAWRTGGGPLQVIPIVDIETVLQERSRGSLTLLDVRGAGEWNAGHITGAVNIPYGSLEERIGEVPSHGPVVVHCQSGARAAIAASLLRRSGVEDVRLFSGGFAEWRAGGYPIERSPA